ncbi:FHA domain-containing protein [Microbacterium sp. Bi121]|uniref:FHA domain-containing protein n=1 Tax=Microbacterium sp. Bi121 TaxID=2822348 RepID=UPI001DC73DF8|nr:FHA domain-containing protein [Microbacterium sp. Bi121]CAH0123092.1 hypothetical protein SRABI121_00271 [Microbacterium sp. Bi121]
MQTTYRPGQWNVLVTPGALIALSPDAPAELLTRLWERERTAGDLAAVIDVLTEHASGSFADMLGFAAVVLEGADARIAVRGAAMVEVTGSEGRESFSGANVTTWSERFVAGASRIEITTDGDEDAVSLPVSAGIVRASHAAADIEPADVTIPDAAAAVVHDADESERIEDAPVEEVPVEEVPVADVPVEEAPVEEPVSEEPVIDEQAADEPVADEPSTDEPSTDEPVTEQIETPAEAVADEVDGNTLMPNDETFASDADEFDQLFGATIASPNAVTPPVPPAPAPLDGDHDGATISVAEARALRQSAPTAAPDAPTAVLPVVSSGSGRVRVSTGQVVALDRTVIIGRRPRSTRASGADLPHLIAVESPQQDISRSHLEIRPEGDTVVVIDLHTTNGSTLLRPGADPLRLHPGEPTLVLSSDVVDLGDGVTVVFEDLP